jgi:hypothetical protein
MGLLVLGLAWAPGQTAGAFEALDGRIQVHGFVEEQLRVLDGSFNEEADLAQWYNVLTLENEFDIAPNGFGPIDLLSAYARIEAATTVYRTAAAMNSVTPTATLPGLLQRLRRQDKYGGVIEAGRGSQESRASRTSGLDVGASRSSWPS